MDTGLRSGCSKCIELEERNRKVVDGFRVSVMDLEEKEKEARCESVMLRNQLGELKLRNVALQEELEKKKSMCNKLGYELAQLEYNLMIVSDSERLAKAEAEIYKNHCRELNITIMNLKDVKCMCQKVDGCNVHVQCSTPVQREAERRKHEILISDVESVKGSSFIEEGGAANDQTKGKCGTQAKKCLLFGHRREQGFNHTSTISTDEVSEPGDVILIDDSNDETEFTHKMMYSARVDSKSSYSGVDMFESLDVLKEIANPKDLEVTNSMHCDRLFNGNLSDSEKTFLLPRTPKKKRRYKVVTSDSEGEEDVNDDNNNMPCRDRNEHRSQSEFREGVDSKSGDSVVETLESLDDLKEIANPNYTEVTNSEHCDRLELDGNPSDSKRTFLPPHTPKKKLKFKVVTSDTEGEEDVYDVNNNMPCGHRNEHGSPSEFHEGVGTKSGDSGVHTLESLDDLKEIANPNYVTNSEHCDRMKLDGDPSDSKMTFLPQHTPKKKRRCNVVTSDTEEEEVYDDNKNIPVDGNENGSPSEFHEVLHESFDNDDREELLTSRRHLVRLGHCKKVKECGVFEQIKVDEVGPESGNESGSERESLAGFIVQESSDSESENVSSAASGDEKYDVDFIQILKKLRRQKDTSKWDDHAQMLASLGGSTELCMKAVCALYRRQTLEEQSSRSTIYNNKRGFSAFDAERCTNLAEFLTDGNTNGPVQKSVQELQIYDPDGPDFCCKIALRYSKQLFDIYQTGEDGYFHL